MLQGIESAVLSHGELGRIYNLGFAELVDVVTAIFAPQG
jgi:hypothetical protein